MLGADPGPFLQTPPAAPQPHELFQGVASYNELLTNTLCYLWVKQLGLEGDLIKSDPSTVQHGASPLAPWGRASAWAWVGLKGPSLRDSRRFAPWRVGDSWQLRREADSTCLGHGYLLTRYQKGRHGNETLASLPLAEGDLMTSPRRLAGILAKLFVAHAWVSKRR